MVKPANELFILASICMLGSISPQLWSLPGPGNNNCLKEQAVCVPPDVFYKQKFED